MKNAFTMLVCSTSGSKFSRWGGTTRTIGETIDDVCLLVPLPPDPDGKEQWLGYNSKYQFVLLSPISKSDSGEMIKVDDPIHFLRDVKPYLGLIRQFLPKVFTFEMFSSVCKDHEVREVKDTTAFWGSNKRDQMLICYGRLLEIVPNPNEVILLEDKIEITKFTTEQ